MTGALLLAGALSPSAHALTADDVVCDKCIDASDIKTGAVNAGQIAKNAVRTGKFKNGVITNAKIALGAINSASVQNNSLTATDLIADSVTASELATGAVTTTDIASSAVTGAKIVDGSVATVDFGDSAISGVQIADGAVTAVKIADGTVTSAKIANGTVTSAKIADGSITGTEIANGLLTSVDLKDEAGVDFYNGISSDASGSGRIDLTTDWTTANSITLSVPATGNVTCVGSGYLDWDLGTWSDDALLGWSNSPTGVPVGVQILNFPGTADSSTLVPMTSMYTFPVSTGTQTFYLRSKISSGTATDVDFIYGVGSACMYFPTSYASIP